MSYSPYKDKKQQVFTSSGTWTRPAGVNWVEVILVGGGGAGTSGVAGAGGQVKKRILTITGNLTITIGIGGVAEASESGGNSSISGGASLSAFGGLKSHASRGEGSGGGGHSAFAGASGDLGFGGGGSNSNYPTNNGGGYHSGNGIVNTGGGGGCDTANGGSGICIITWEQ